MIVKEDCARSKDWRAVVALCAMEHCREQFAGPVIVEVIFYVPRPKGHYRTAENRLFDLKKSAPLYPTTKPDCTKLWRSTEDALKGLCWADDSQVVDQRVRKLYSLYHSRPGADIVVRGVAESVDAVAAAIGVTL